MKCKDCVFWIMGKCEGAATPCNYLETYNDWDQEQEIIDNMY